MNHHEPSTVHARWRRGRRLARRALVPAVAALALTAAGCASTTGGAASTSGGAPVTFVISVRALDNAYSAAWVTGAKALAKHLGYPASDVKVLQSGSNDEAQVTQLQTFLASSTGKVAIAVDPNTNAIAQSIVSAVQRDPNAYVTVFWNKPANLWPWNGYSHWVSFVNFNGVTSGEQTAKVLFQRMRGKGGIIALQGILNDVPSQQRFAGLQQALKSAPGVHLLQQQTANWDETQAFNVTKSLLAKYSGQIKGVWSANDEMAVGALQALHDSGVRDVPVVSASDAIPQVLQSIKSGGGIYTTTNPDGYYDGSTGLALAYYAATGKLNVSSLSHAKRAFYAKAALVDSSNVGQFLTPPNASQYAANWTVNGLFDRMDGPIQP